MDVMGLFQVKPRLLALGEPTHGEDDLLRVRNDLFRHLVEQHGYRTITLESDCLMGLLVDDYVTAGAGTLDDVMARGFSHEWGAFAGNRELVSWMREHNHGRPGYDQVRFAGFDGPLEISHAASPRHALTALHACLAGELDADLTDTLDRLLGPDDRWTDPAVMWDPSKSIGRTPEAGQLRLLADDLAALVDTRIGDQDWHRARLYARTAVGLLRYHYWMADTSPRRLTRLAGQRDSMMAANLLALAGQGPTLAYAHNSHLQRDQSSMRMGGRLLEWWGAGAIVNAHLGPGYGFVATAVGTIHHHGVGTPPPDTIEGLLYAQPRSIVDPRTLIDAKPAARTSPWYGYAPLDPAYLTRYDGIVFVQDAEQR
ncbi:MAG: erythromycin esterase family protein [Kibdelosporangium sp.]